MVDVKNNRAARQGKGAAAAGSSVAAAAALEGALPPAVVKWLRQVGRENIKIAFTLVFFASFFNKVFSPLQVGVEDIKLRQLTWDKLLAKKKVRSVKQRQSNGSGLVAFDTAR